MDQASLFHNLPISLNAKRTPPPYRPDQGPQTTAEGSFSVTQSLRTPEANIFSLAWAVTDPHSPPPITPHIPIPIPSSAASAQQQHSANRLPWCLADLHPGQGFHRRGQRSRCYGDGAWAGQWQSWWAALVVKQWAGDQTREPVMEPVLHVKKKLYCFLFLMNRSVSTCVFTFHYLPRGITWSKIYEALFIF